MMKVFSKKILTFCLIVLGCLILSPFKVKASDATPQRLATEHPNPLPLAKVKSGHPRLWFNQENLSLLRARWNDPEYKKITDIYKNSSNAISSALKYLATGNVNDAQNAISEALGYGNNASSGAVNGKREAAWGDVPAIVFDWCYDQLNNNQKADLISKIQNRSISLLQQKVKKRFQWHEFFDEVTSYTSAVLAIEGERGVSSQLREAQNVLQNFQELGDEVSGEGAYQSYLYQGRYQPLCFFLWTTATDLDFVSKSGFTKNLPEFAIRRLSKSGSRFTRGPGDDLGGITGNVLSNMNLSAGIFYMIAHHFNDPLAQWLGNILRDRGQANHWVVSKSPNWLSLIYYDPSNPGQSPDDLNHTTVKYFSKNGMVSFRSGWNFSPNQQNDVLVWFYNGPSTTHSEASQNHFTIWRGKDDLAIAVGNYFGSPSRYKDHYQKHAIARNTLIFSPKGSSAPDKDGGQINGENLRPESAQNYPLADELTYYRGETSYRGQIVYFQDTPDYSITTGDAGIAYDHDNVIHYLRDVVYVKPNIFLIRDRFATSNVDNIRWILHSRTKPISTSPNRIIRGNSDAGILEANLSNFIIEKGESQLTADILWPSSPLVRFIGGPGYEAWVDGSNSDPAKDAGSFLLGSSELKARMELSKNQWRTEIESTPLQADGNIIVALFISEKAPVEKPFFSLREEGNLKIAVVSYKGKNIEIRFPSNEVPEIKGARPDTEAPSAPRNIRIRQ